MNATQSTGGASLSAFQGADVQCHGDSLFQNAPREQGVNSGSKQNVSSVSGRPIASVDDRSAIPEPVAGRSHIYLVGLAGGVVKVGRTQSARSRMKWYGGELVWRHFFPHVDECAAPEIEALAIDALGMSGAATARGREYFCGIGREAAVCVVRYVVASFDARAYEETKLRAVDGAEITSSPYIPIAQIRRENLLTLLREIADESGERGSSRRLSQRSGVPEPIISQVKNGRSHGSGATRTIGSDVARKLEAGAGKPFGWMDQRHSALTCAL
jgi:hypothetical protein